MTTCAFSTTHAHSVLLGMCLGLLAPLAASATFPLLDPSFGTGGMVAAPDVSGAIDRVIIQADGKPIVADSYVLDRVLCGYFSSCWILTDGIIRLDVNGAVDPSFSNGGLFVSGLVRKLLLQRDG